ncbi:MAG: hypothetical protein H0T46_36000 [Deltaproteobacteria bacterium]|nr:hypothetical protein [Deltaproteobacteria bacterium]
MSRAWVTTLAVGILLLAAFGVVVEPYWPGLSAHAWWEIALVITLGAYGACFAAVSIPRIVDPRLSIPLLAWILIAVGYTAGAFRRAERRREMHDHELEVRAFGPGDDRKHMGRGWAIFATLFAFGMIASSVALVRYFASRPVDPTAATTRQAPPRSAAAPAPAAAPRVPTNILDVGDLPGAIAFALPSMTDDRRAPNVGAKLLARWGTAKLTWTEVVPPTNETSLELAEKDPSQAWGKRLCASGTLARIEKLTIDGTELHSARLVTKTGDALELYVVGNTGTLVKRKPARFCGVVTGRLDVAGKPATFAVGMFEIRAR